MPFVTRPISCAAWAAPSVPLVFPERRARQDVFRAFNPPVLTPAFDAFARSSVLFRNAYANGSWTLPSVATILTGRYLAKDMYDEEHRVTR